jgi:hypothetical protein
VNLAIRIRVRSDDPPRELSVTVRSDAGASERDKANVILSGAKNLSVRVAFPVWRGLF